MLNQKPKSVAELLAEGNSPEALGALAGTPGTTAAPVPTAANIAGSFGNMDMLAQLVQILLLKEGREAAKLQQEENQRAARQAQRDRNAKDQDSKILLKQARCKHLKGGKRGPKTQQKDYAVYQHTFINADTVIRCQVCGMRWRQQDTAEYLLRNGKKIANHTKVGWREAIAMLDQSSNTISSSEVPGQILTGAVRIAGSTMGLDSAGLPFNTQVVDLEGNAVESVEL